MYVEHNKKAVQCAVIYNTPVVYNDDDKECTGISNAQFFMVVMTQNMLDVLTSVCDAHDKETINCTDCSHPSCLMIMTRSLLDELAFPASTYL